MYKRSGVRRHAIGLAHEPLHLLSERCYTSRTPLSMCTVVVILAFIIRTDYVQLAPLMHFNVPARSARQASLCRVLAMRRRRTVVLPLRRTAWPQFDPEDDHSRFASCRALFHSSLGSVQLRHAIGCDSDANWAGAAHNSTFLQCLQT